MWLLENAKQAEFLRLCYEICLTHVSGWESINTIDGVQKTTEFLLLHRFST